ncbi:MAG TPA: lytic murein transglycosylase [Stellaceae bacterium]|nr:lytic murein transglycosylase [Stellaceae bacterium]
MTGRLISLLLSLLLVGLSLAPARAAEEDFPTWLAGLRAEAQGDGIRPATLDRALAGIEPIPRVIELDRQQPESTITYEAYLRFALKPERVKAARQHLHENRVALAEVGRRFGVQPRFIVALWGIETRFGKLTGNFPVIAALATLAYDGRRSTFFRSELIAALHIADEGKIDPQEMLGSWAGAMGQSQFMPSSYLRFAVSYRGDGHGDIWHSREDVFASIANYLHQSGWHGDETWGRQVRLPATFDPALIGLGVKKSVAEWRKLGVRRSDDGPLPARALQASLLRPGGDDGPAVLVYQNYRVLLQWNNSNFFASAVGLLANSMEGR